MRFRSRLGLGVALALALTGASAPAPKAVLTGSYEWDAPGDRFGGFSGIDIAEDGTTFVAISDSAAIFSGRLTRDDTGAVVAVEANAPVFPLSHHGLPLTEPMDDAEGLALGPDGTIYISFETEDRIAQYADGGATWVTEFWPPRFRTFALNAGIEALAIDGSGALYAMPERDGPPGSPIPVFRLIDGTMEQPFTLPRSGDWSQVGADFGPDGRLFLLERDFWPLIGFMSRVRRITIEADSVVADEVLLETSAGVHDNLEGIAVWRDGAGDTHLTMISDDNFLPVQRTEIVDYRVVE